MNDKKKIKPVVLLILDGWGLAPKSRGNAIELAKKPNFDKIWQEYSHTQLKASGQFVGLPKKQVGNSEAGHINIGAGRVEKQDAVLISEAIKDGRFAKNTALNQVLNFVNQKKSILHLIGMVAEGDSPHSSLEHLFALIQLAKTKKVGKVLLHLFTDGRDSPQFGALKILDKISRKLNGTAEIATVMGRYYGMDRAKNWGRTKLAYECLTNESCVLFGNYRDAILRAYNQGITDEYIEPSAIAIGKSELKRTRIKENDGIIFFNLRSDRARQLSKSFVQENFNQMNPEAFLRGKMLANIKFCAFTDFGPDLNNILTAFPSPDVKNSLPMVLHDLKQVYIAETEKFAHVTYFINGGYADPVNGEDRLKIASPVVKSYAHSPAMSVYALTARVNGFVQKGIYDFVTVNFANPDMVGHTGDLKATVKAIEHVDVCLGRVVKEVLKKDGTLLVTADHGNAEKMLDLETEEIWSGHTDNPVPFIMVNKKLKHKRLNPGVLGNIAPTIYDILDYNNLPDEIDKSLLK